MVFVKFSSAFDTTYIINTTHNDNQLCEELCAENNEF